MIIVSITDDSITLSGHAGYAPRGQDIVCEAVTILCHTLEASIAPGRCEKRSGFFRADRRGTTHDEEVLFNGFITGLEILSEVYPDFIQINK